MANYSLIANSTFQPFSYQELMAPVARMSDVHSAIAEQYDKLSSQADVLEAMGNNDRDKGSGTYGRYKAYSDALRAEAENLYRNGLDINSRMRLSDLRRRYNQEIVPIQNAWNKREQEAEVQMKAKLQNPSLRFTRDASTSTLDDYLANPTGGYGVVNLNAITADMAAAAKTLEGQIKRGAKVEGVDSTTYNYIQRWGLSDAMINEWIKNPDSNSALTNMMNQVLAKHGVTEQALAGTQNGAAILAEGRQAAQLGAWHSMGKDQGQLHTNQAAVMALQEQYAERREARQLNNAMTLAGYKAALKNAAAGGVGGAGGEGPTVYSRYVGVTPSDQYRADGMKILESLKTGYDGVKKSIFGSRIGEVNPMKIYDEYQKEVERTNKTAARKTILERYKKYGVSDILTEDQYDLLKGMGYSASKKIRSNRFSNLKNGFNNMVVANSSYSTAMSNYNYPDSQVRRNLALRNEMGNDLGLYEIDKNGKAYKFTNYKDLNLYSSENTKGNKVTDVEYDPRFPDKVVITLSGGSKPRRIVANPDLVGGEELTRIINQIRNTPTSNPGAIPQRIAQEISYYLNSYNKTKSTSEKDTAESSPFDFDYDIE